MKRTIIINTIISAVVAIVVALISLFDKSNQLADTLRFSLYDFILLQIFLMVLELYIYIQSEFMKLLGIKPYRNLIKALEDYNNRENIDGIQRSIVEFSLEESVKYTKIDNIDSCQIPRHMMKKLMSSFFTNSQYKVMLCDYKKFESNYANYFDELIVYYDNYAELYRFFHAYSEIPSVKKKVKFYRRHEDTMLKTYFILDQKYVFTEKNSEFYQIFSSNEIILRYYADFEGIKNKSVSWGKTQNQDSLFLNQSIKEFYGEGNRPDIHLNIIKGSYRKILDLGTGAGRLLYYFTDYNKYEVIAMDKDDTALNECRRNYGQFSHINFMNEEFNENSFKPNEFDLVIAYNSLYHTDRASMHKIISRVKMILRQGGYFLFTIKTLEGNENIYKHAGELIPEHPENTFINTKFPDYYLPHHFCDDEEITTYLNMFSKVLYREEIPYKEYNGDIVQGKGIYFILQK